MYWDELENRYITEAELYGEDYNPCQYVSYGPPAISVPWPANSNVPAGTFQE